MKKNLPYLSARFFDGISSGLFMMALPWLILKTPNMGTFVALTALTCTVTSFIMTPFISTLVDRHSRKAILLLVQIVQSSTAALVAALFWFDVGNVWALAAAQLIFWVSSNLAWLTNNAFTQENFERHEYAKISSYQEIILQSTTLGAGALGVVLLQVWDVPQFALFAASASGLSVLCYIFTPYRRQLRETQNSVSFIKQVIEIKSIFTSNTILYSILMLSSLTYPLLTLLGNLMPIVFSERGVSGEWYAGYNVAFGLGSLLTGLLLSKLLSLGNHLNIICVTMFAVSIALFGISLAPHPMFILIFTLTFGFFNALNRIARTNWMHIIVPINIRGRVEGGIAMFTTTCQSVFYVLVALLSHFQWSDLGFTLGASVSLIAASILLILKKQYMSHYSTPVNG
ncbi:MFS transporter [Vibrio sp. 404]|uniref:MFS transporter n=1 Tax=Vibrio marinisediminis TaxID=2758441 RepID=A0A7W2FMX1_9VIBR|nr:MFS transporter [Vibrio marinisediminis]MBA5761038.1 MFS transporter [Vibrio marinisediminis]